ncbi:mitochondrial carrier domain-containing protein [Polychytrium aggregatum]|uniref:mitochondrial carrier domain-containing protein n=1 Tax=Polychytrium aggregatum TaxID=110093 RepID=UPI0022FE2442|nr:mitochondrial carrier domain-containing protein [Polychytrium aggregatum]KAI9205110.1 mitochondrial carrier domain-containing protein [Polychytrium aggregatum]
MRPPLAHPQRGGACSTRAKLGARGGPLVRGGDRPRGVGHSSSRLRPGGKALLLDALAAAAPCRGLACLSPSSISICSYPVASTPHQASLDLPQGAETDSIRSMSSSSTEVPSQKHIAIDFGAGVVGGTSGVLVGHPLDTIKVRLQSQAISGHRYRNLMDCFATIIKEEKISGLYKGMSSPLFGVAVINSLLFGVYGWFLRHLDNGRESSIATIFWAGNGSGFVNAFFSCPMELVKIRLQNQFSTPSGSSAPYYRGPLDCCSKIYRAEGIRGFYRGFGCTLIRETPSYGVYFASYELLCRYCVPEGAPLDKPTAGLLFAGGMAGVMAWMITYPFDVVKTRLQSVPDASVHAPAYRGTFDCMRQIIAKEGIRTLFAGAGATAIRAFPTNAATFYAVCWFQSLFQ